MLKRSLESSESETESESLSESEEITQVELASNTPKVSLKFESNRSSSRNLVYCSSLSFMNGKGRRTMMEPFLNKVI